MSRSLKVLLFIAAASVTFLGGIFFAKQNLETPSPFLQSISHHVLTKKDVAQILGKRPLPYGMLETSEVVPYKGTDLLVQYSIDLELQKNISTLLKSGQIRYGAFVAIDVKTGRVLAMASHGMPENLTLRSTFPSASLFKIVTASAALSRGVLSFNSLIPMQGSYHTLYRHNLFYAGGITPSQEPQRARLISFSDAFGKSVNSVFGKVGIYGLGAETLKQHAKQMLFDTEIPFDMALDTSHAFIPQDPYGLAESASGFTRSNTISPLHGALLAAAVANDGIIMEPTVVSHIFDREGMYEYTPTVKPLSLAFNPEAASQLRYMMQQTISTGTCRRAFCGYQKHVTLSQLSMGGKSGTLNGNNPPGRYDWFVGYAQQGDRRIAISVLCIHGTYRGIKSATIARKAFETYFRPNFASASSYTSHQ